MFAGMAVVGAAWACSCIAAPPTLGLPEQAHAAGPIRFLLWGGWSDGETDRMAGMLRVRGPDGALVPVAVWALGRRLDFVPDHPLPPGRYAIERVLPQVGDDQRWYVTGELEVVDSAEPVSSVPAVSWERETRSTSCGPPGSIRARVPPIPGARWLEVEVAGLGVVTTFPADHQERIAYVSDGSCVPHKITLPADEALEVRVVAVELDGHRVPGAWSTLGAVGPAHPSRGPVPELRHVEVPAEVTFEEADGCWNVIEPNQRGR